MCIRKPIFTSAMIATLVALTFSGAAQAAGRVALVIGNGSYKTQSPLPNPPRDAADVSASLTRLGFSVVTLIDADANASRKALIEFGRASAGADMSIVFYAGHGIEVAGENWLLPIDVELRNDTDVEYEAVSLKAVTAQVAKARMLGLVILDACRNNPFIAKMQRSVGMRSPSRGLARVEPTDNVLVAYAAKDGTTASDGDGRNSPFTAALLRNLELPGVEINFMFRTIHDEVRAATKREQQPVVYGSLSRQEIYLKPVASGGNSATTTTQSAARDWEVVKDSQNINALEAFARTYADSFYAELAKARIVEIKKTTTSALPSPTRTLTSAKGTEASTIFGGSPYCKYSVKIYDARMLAPADADGNITNAKLTLSMLENTVPPCTYPPIGLKQHTYSGAGKLNADGSVAINFTAVPGNAPMAAAIFEGTWVDGRLIGKLSVQRVDIGGNLAWKVASQFK